MKVASFIVGLFLLFCMALTPCHADVITFNDVGYPVYDGREMHNPIYMPGYLLPTADGNTLYLPGYSDGILDTAGFRFSGQHFHTIDRPVAHGNTLFGGAPDNGTIYLNSDSGYPVTLTSIEGSPFSLISFDGAECFVNVAVAAQYRYLTATAINVTGVRLDGTQLSMSFPLDGINDGIGSSQDFQTFTFTSDWYNLTSVTFAGLYGSSAAGFSLDNVYVESGMVYEPTPVTINNKRLMVNGKTFIAKGVVYSPVPIGDDPTVAEPYGDYFTLNYSTLYNRDLPLIRAMGANTIRIITWNNAANHFDFLNNAFNNGVDPIYVIAGYWINSELDIDPQSPTNVRDQLKADFRAMVATHKNHPSILMWSIGSDLNASSMYGSNLTNLFSLINDMAAEAHAEEGASFHPVTTPLADSAFRDVITTYEASVPSLDIWGINAYRGNSFGTLFNDVRAVSAKPLIILEYGIDAYDTAHGDEYEHTGTPYQAEYVATLWNEIALNSDVCIGGTVMEYSDEWWRGILSTDQNCSDEDPLYHGICGQANSAQPDGYSNEEWRGIMRVVPATEGPDIMEPKASYSILQSLWVPPPFSVRINNDDTYTRSTTVTLTLSCNDSTKCQQMQFSNDGVTWSTQVTFSTTRNWYLSAGDGGKTVYARFRDTAGNWSQPFSDTIVLDRTVPATTASPVGGNYTSAQTVTLTCGDGTGSGCNNTYFTIDGTTPTTSSSVYGGPILIASTTTLKYFSTDRAGNTEAVKTQTYNLDTNAPTGTISINGGASYAMLTTVSLTLSCTDNTACSQMQFSNDGSTWSTPGAYSSSRTWYLTAGDGGKTVYVKFRDTVGNWSQPFSDTIVLDRTVPATTASPVGGNYTSAQTVTLTCGDGTGSGCNNTYFTIDGTTPSTSSSVYGGPILIASTTTLKYFSTDRAGNTEAVKTQTYNLDTNAPTGTISINGGAQFTRSGGVTLTLSCSDNTQCTYMQFSNDGTTWSSPATYATTRSWNLTTGDGEKTVYAKFRDNVGNWSEVYSDTIVLDMTRPLNGTVAAIAGTGQISLNWAGFSDALSGISSYTLVFGAGTSPSSCTTGTLLYSGPDSSYVHTGLTPGSLYYYRVCATDNAGNISTGALSSARPN